MEIHEPVAGAIGRGLADDAGWELLSELTALPERFGGHAGERRAANRVGAALEAAGLAPEFREFELTRWERGQTTLRVDGTTREAVALPYSPAAEVTGPVVDVGHGSPAEIEAADPAGAIALTTTAPPPTGRHPHRMETVGHAAEAGAAGLLFANHHSGQLPPTGTVRPETPIPCAGVSKETGDRLRDGDRRAELAVAAETAPATSQNVLAAVGPATDEELLVLAHYDAHDVGEGALDNGAGVAVLVGAVRILAELSLERRVRVAAVGCEEIGLLGSEALAAERSSPPRVVVNLDGAGRFRDVRALTHGCPALAEPVESVADELGHPVAAQSRPHAYSDHWPFLRAGVPSLQLHSRRPGDPGAWERGYTHTRADTRDKVDRRDLRTHAIVAALAVRELAADPPEPLVPATVRDRLREAGAEPGMRTAGSWPAAWD